ncbi:MAG: transposase [Pyrinomonadaceae bacterium]
MDTNEWDENLFPLAYLITFRTYGTWLHGDNRGSVDTHHKKNRYGTPKIQPNDILQRSMHRNMKNAPVLLEQKQRVAVDIAIKEVCQHRGFLLYAVNVRTNHVHAVISAESKPEPIINSLKSYSTRKLRELKLISSKSSPWSRGGSRRYLWKEKHVGLAIDYVLYCQGDVPFEPDD